MSTETTSLALGRRPRGIRRPVLDVTWFLTAWLVLLYGLSAGVVVPGFGAIGQPATLVALIAPMWWASGRALPSLGLDQGFQPVRIALYVYVGYMLASYGMGSTRTLSGLEQSNSTREVITMMALFGIAALTADGIHDPERLRTLLRRLTTFGAVFAAFGLVQFIAGEELLFTPPGLTWNGDTGAGVGSRQGFNRPLSTGLHPIEFAVVVASLLPLAIHFALHPRNRADRLRAVVEGLLLFVAVPVSLSRSAVVCLVAALVVLASGWSWRRRGNAVALVLLGLPIAVGLLPGVFEVMVELFAESATDPSVQARLQRIPNVMAMIRERPWFGWGYGTFNPMDYFLLDNQVWSTTISTGIVGILVTLGLPFTAVVAALWTRYRPRSSEESRHLGRAIAGGITGMTVSLATFDAFYYRILTFTLFLLIGCAAALWRMTAEGLEVDHSADGEESRRPPPTQGPSPVPFRGD